MSKLKTSYQCSNCGTNSPKWLGQCQNCQQWNTFVETIISTSKEISGLKHHAGYANAITTDLQTLDTVETKDLKRVSTGLTELDRVLGGGLVAGSVILIGGDPGIGKSTLLLETLINLSIDLNSIYITGEESLQQVKMRAVRLGKANSTLKLLAETNIEIILANLKKLRPKIVVIDSIQTCYTELITSAPGSVSQLRETTAMLVRFAKSTATTIFLVGHVTKEGALAGPRVLEHMVDTVLYFEGDGDQRYRAIRAIKNRFGAANELGIFAMTDKGLKIINNPSAIFVSRQLDVSSGSMIMVSKEGTRALLVEIQALVDGSHLANPRRVCVGIEQNRLGMLLAILNKHGGVFTYQQDVFVNVVGGVKISETAGDLPIVIAIYSSLKDQAIPKDWVAFGELGLSGEVRPVQNGQDRLKEAEKLGFKNALIPKANLPKSNIYSIKLHPVANLSEALDIIRNLVS